MEYIYTIEEYVKWLKEYNRTSTYENLMKFKEYCLDRTFICPACEEECVVDFQDHFYETRNTDCVCDDCIINGYYS